MAKIKNRVFQAAHRAERQRMIDEGAYDGRYRTRKVTSKKREESRRACRNYRYA